MSQHTKSPYAEVWPVARHIVDTLRPFCDRVEIAGSLRRERPFIGDIEIVAIPIRPTDLFGNIQLKQPTQLDAFFAEKNVNLIKNGPLQKQFKYGRFTIDLFLPTVETWGSVYLIRTGSHKFNMWIMSTWAPKQGIKFHEGRLYKGLDPTPLNTTTETAVFDVLGLPYIKPEDRDGERWLNFA